MKNDQLCHHGIKGMRWGVRRSPAQLGHDVPAIKGPLSKAKTAPAEEKRRSVEEMSDEELRSKLNRLQMEKQYSQLLAEKNPKKEHKVAKFLGEVALQTVKSLANKATEKIVNNMFKEEKEDRSSNILFEDVSTVGDKALTKAIQRMNAEKTYRGLIDETKKARSGGK